MKFKTVVKFRHYVEAPCGYVFDEQKIDDICIFVGDHARLSPGGSSLSFEEIHQNRFENDPERFEKFLKDLKSFLIKVY